MLFSVARLTALLLQYKYFLLFPIAVFEGPIITLITGFLILEGYMSFEVAYPVIVVGDIIGDIIHYLVGFWGGEPFVRRWGKYFFIDERHIKAAKRIFETRGSSAFILAKFLHGIGGVIQVAAGMVRAPFKKFLAFMAAGTLVKTLALLLIGYYFSQAISKINSYLDFFASASIVLGIAALLFVMYRYGKKIGVE